MSNILAAEQGVLRIALEHPDTCERIFAKYPAHAFTPPENSYVAEAIHGLHIERKAIDQILVNAEMERRGTLSRVGPAFVFKLPYTSVEVLDGYLDELVRHLRLRRLSATGAAINQHAEQPNADPLAIAHRMVTEGQTVLDAADLDTDIHIKNLGEFLDTEDPEYDWVIPGLLERGDRLLLTGSEGLGKSTLFRQMAVATAAGVNPFTGDRIPPQRTLYVDCENGPVHIRRRLKPLAVQARHLGHGADQTMFVDGKPEGLDLTKPTDAQWLIRAVSTIQPSVLFTGSLYKLFVGDPNKEEPARQVAAVLDRIRAVANCAVVVEAHSGHSVGGDGRRSVRPIGASLWLRWPEFGYGIRPQKDFTKENRLVDFVAWRGDRDERPWPKHMKAGGKWAWTDMTCGEPDCCGWAPHRGVA